MDKLLFSCFTMEFIEKPDWIAVLRFQFATPRPFIIDRVT